MNALAVSEVRDTAGSYVLAEVADDAVAAGYKRTDVGVIPEDWAVVKAGDIGRFRGGNGFPLRYQGGSTGAFPFFKVSDMNNEGNETFMRFANHYVSAGVQKELGATIFPPESIIFAKVGAAIFLERKKILDLPSCIDNNVAAFVLDRSASDVRFVHYLMLDTKLSDLASTTALPSLSGKVLRELLLVLPALDEQRAIAAALSDVDALLLGLDQLIAKKRDLKQAAMQQLLTCQVRLPGFDDEWHETQLGRLGRFSKGKGIRKDQVMTDGLPCIRYGEIYTRHHDVVRSFGSFISPQVASQSQRLLRGDLLFAGSGETAEEIGKCVAFLDDKEAYASGDIVIFSPTKQDSMYLGYLMNAPQIAAQKARMGQGDAVVHVGARNLAQLEFNLPSLAEQTAIATVLSDMDAELATLETRRDKTRELKQGMMQALLTGRIRLT